MSEIHQNRAARLLPVLALALVLVLLSGTMPSAKGPIVHRVTAGGPDACLALGYHHPGCDANFSLVALQNADGSVSGQYTDRYANGDGFHAAIDCLVVEGNQAWVSGVITHGIWHAPWGEVFDLTGLPVATRLKDNGTSANDPPDQTSFSMVWLGGYSHCSERPDYELFDAPQGQVKIN
jgi:hypothetical protein